MKETSIRHEAPNNKPHIADRRLLKNLGLQQWTSRTGEKKFIGEVLPLQDEGDSNTSIEIWVVCLPAQFYQFEIYCSDSDRRYEVKTGSGLLTEYYPMAKAIALGMLNVTKLN